MIKILVGFTLVLILSGCYSCISWGEKNFRPIKLNFVLTKKRIEFEKECIFEGKTPEGKSEILRLTSAFSWYKAAEVGDTIRKDSGDMRLYFIKKDTTIVFTYHCSSSND